MVQKEKRNGIKFPSVTKENQSQVDMYGELKEMYEILGKAEAALLTPNNSIAVVKGEIGMLHLKMDPKGELRREVREKIYLEELLKVTEIDGVDVMERNGENGPTIISAYEYDVGDVVIVKGVVVHRAVTKCTTHPIGEVVGFTPGKILVEVELSGGESEIIIVGVKKIQKVGAGGY